jgi:Fur family transcriptional regulator, ferric uptake regulator
MQNKLPVNKDQQIFPRQDEHKDIPGKKIIRDIGLKVTLQRLAILETVRRGPTHFTAQEIFETVTENHPDIGFATVYRFLKKLSEQHYVTEFRLGGMPARYEWVTKNHHDHLSCTHCGKIIEFENPKIESLQEAIAEAYGFDLTDHVLELYGVCPQCQKKNNANKSPQQ